MSQGKNLLPVEHLVLSQETTEPRDDWAASAQVMCERWDILSCAPNEGADYLS